MQTTRTSWLFASAALLGLAIASGVWAQEKRFNVPAQAAVKAIPEFASQAGIQIVAPADRLKGIRTKAVKGDMDVRDALLQLLEGTGLEIASDNGSVISLRVKAAGSQAIPSAAVVPNNAPPVPDTVIVTGSRLIRRGYKAPTPVTVFDDEEVRLSGTLNVETLLNDNPQFIGSQNNGPTGMSIPGGTATLNLRGFGDKRNLVLVNGRRFAISGPDLTTDINTITPALIKRTEVVTGGSSAVYGSDAITGVVNFIMRDDFQGVELNAQSRMDTHTNTPTYGVDLTLGRDFAEGRGNMVVALNFLNRGGYTRGDRGGWATPSLGDGCVTAASWSATTAGVPLSVPSGQTCLSTGGRPGLIYSGSSTVPNTRIGNLPVVGSSGSNQALDTALIASGLQNMTTLGAVFSDDGATIRPYRAPADSYDLGPAAYLLTPQERWVGNIFGHYDLNDKVTSYLEVHISDNVVGMQLPPSGVSGNFLFDINNPYLSAPMREVLRQLDLKETGTTTLTNGTLTSSTTPGDGLAILNINRRLPDVGNRSNSAKRSVFRTAFGVRGHWDDVSPSFARNLNYDLYYSFARMSQTDTMNGSVSLSAFARGLRSQGGVAPALNIFGQNITSAAATSIAISSINTTEAEQQVINGTIAGELFEMPAGPVDFSSGFEWRYNSVSFVPDNYLSSGDVSGFNSALPTSGSTSVKEVFGELRVPIIANMPFIRNLNLNGAFRYSDYSLKGVGGVWTYSLGSEWSPNRDIAFRAQFQHAIRAPNVGELYGGNNTSGPSGTDPCSSRQPAAQQTATVKAICVATGVPAALVFDTSVQPSNFLTTVLGGNPNVGAEQSDTRTLGVIFTPSRIKGLALSIDYFNIDLDGAIAPLGGNMQNTLNLCYNVIQTIASEFCQAVHRDPITGQIAAPGFVTGTSANTGGLLTSGIDIESNYGFEIGWRPLKGRSRLNFSTNYTWTDEMTITPVQAFPYVKNYCIGAFGSTCGQPIPEWKGVSRVTWKNGPLMLSLRHRYISAVTVDTYLLPKRTGGTYAGLETLTNPVIEAQNYVDITAIYDLRRNMQVNAGIRNLFDKDPPIVGSPQPANNTFAATYDVEGMVLFGSLTVRF